MFKGSDRQFSRQLIPGMALFMLLHYGSVGAEPIPPGLSISVQIELNTLSIAPRGAAFQTAAVTLLTDGSKTAAISGTQVVAGSLPLSGTLSGTGEVLAIEAQIEGDGAAAASGLLFDIVLDLSNNTIHESYTLSFQAHRNLSLNVTGKDAVADAAGSFTNATIQEQLFNPWKFVADVYFDGQSSPGDSIDVVEIDLPPGTSLRLNGSVDLQGDTNLFDLSGPDDHFDGRTIISLVLDAVRGAQSQGEPTPIPTLSIWGMLLLGALLLTLIRRHPNYSGD